MVFCFEITFKIVKMRSISAVDFFSYEFVISVLGEEERGGMKAKQVLARRY